MCKPSCENYNDTRLCKQQPRCAIPITNISENTKEVILGKYQLDTFGTMATKIRIRYRDGLRHNLGLIIAGELDTKKSERKRHSEYKLRSVIKKRNESGELYANIKGQTRQIIYDETKNISIFFYICNTE